MSANFRLVPVSTVPGGDHVVDPVARQAIVALAAAPAALRSRVLRASSTKHGGLTLLLQDGPDLRFGGADRLAAKWAAAAAVLADTGSAGIPYLDLHYPERPARRGTGRPHPQSAIRTPSTRPNRLEHPRRQCRRRASRHSQPQPRQAYGTP